MHFCLKPAAVAHCWSSSPLLVLCITYRPVAQRWRIQCRESICLMKQSRCCCSSTQHSSQCMVQSTMRFCSTLNFALRTLSQYIQTSQSCAGICSFQACSISFSWIRPYYHGARRAAGSWLRSAARSHPSIWPHEHNQYICVRGNPFVLHLGSAVCCPCKDLR